MEETQLPAQYVYVEPCGHGAHFVARLESESKIPGASQFSVIRADGSIDRTLWMSGSSIFRATAISQEKAMLLARELEQRQSIYNADPPQRLLLEAAKPEQPSFAQISEKVRQAQWDGPVEDLDTPDEVDDGVHAPVGEAPNDSEIPF